MSQNILSTNLEENLHCLEQLLPLNQSFDFITRELLFGQTRGALLAVNGFCNTAILQRILSDLQNPIFHEHLEIASLHAYLASKLGFAQVSLCNQISELCFHLCCGPSVLLLDGFSQAILIDARTYPTRSIQEPLTETVTAGCRDGFVETILWNANLIRRRIRSPRLTFQALQIGTLSKTDVAIAYIDTLADKNLLHNIRQALSSLQIPALTMGAKSLQELLIKKSWWTPMPTSFITERPDVACSYLLEGYILLLVDNYPGAIVLPSNFFQFTQSPEDYYKSAPTGTLFRTLRILCIPISLLILPIYLLLTAYYPQIAANLHLLSTDSPSPIHYLVYTITIDFILNLFQYSASFSNHKYGSSLSIVGGLLIGEMAISLNWLTTQSLFYGALTLLAGLTIYHIELADAIRLYRILLILLTGFWGLWGFIAGLLLTTISIIKTPTLPNHSYLWPLYPFEPKSLSSLLLRKPTHHQ